MAGFAYQSLTNSQLSTRQAQSLANRRAGLLSRFAANLRRWRRRIDERAALAKTHPTRAGGFRRLDRGRVSRALDPILARPAAVLTRHRTRSPRRTQA